MNATTSAYRGLPDNPPGNVLTAFSVADECGWSVIPTYAPHKRSIALRFALGTQRVWAIWVGTSFWRAYARTGQRLGYRDLLAVLRDPDLLVPEDTEWPYGEPVVTVAP